MLCWPRCWQWPWHFVWDDDEDELFRILLSPDMRKFASASKGTLFGQGSFFCRQDDFFAIDSPIVVSSRCNKRFVCEGWIASDPPFRRSGDLWLPSLPAGLHVWLSSVSWRLDRFLGALRILGLSIRSCNWRFPKVSVLLVYLFSVLVILVMTTNGYHTPCFLKTGLHEQEGFTAIFWQ